MTDITYERFKELIKTRAVECITYDVYSFGTTVSDTKYADHYEHEYLLLDWHIPAFANRYYIPDWIRDYLFTNEDVTKLRKADFEYVLLLTSLHCWFVVTPEEIEVCKLQMIPVLKRLPLAYSMMVGSDCVRIRSATYETIVKLATSQLRSISEVREQCSTVRPFTQSIIWYAWYQIAYDVLRYLAVELIGDVEGKAVEQSLPDLKTYCNRFCGDDIFEHYYLYTDLNKIIEQVLHITTKTDIITDRVNNKPQYLRTISSTDYTVHYAEILKLLFGKHNIHFVGIGGLISNVLRAIDALLTIVPITSRARLSAYLYESDKFEWHNVFRLPIINETDLDTLIAKSATERLKKIEVLLVYNKYAHIARLLYYKDGSINTHRPTRGFKLLIRAYDRYLTVDDIVQILKTDNKAYVIGAFDIETRTELLRRIQDKDLLKRIIFVGHFSEAGYKTKLFIKTLDRFSGAIREGLFREGYGSIHPFVFTRQLIAGTYILLPLIAHAINNKKSIDVQIDLRPFADI